MSRNDNFSSTRTPPQHTPDLRLQRGTVKGENTAVIARNEVTKQSLLNEIATGYALAMTQREGWKH